MLYSIITDSLTTAPGLHINYKGIQQPQYKQSPLPILHITTEFKYIL